MRLRVSTGRRVLTTRNQSLNILRNTVACYAGAVAGADIITTTPFDAPTGLPSEASRRNARNTQLILAEECHLAQVVDPAGGSWYIEWYTNEVAKTRLVGLPADRGARRHDQGRRQRLGAEQIKPTEAAREKDIAARKVAVTGVSEHPIADREAPRAGAAATTASSPWRRRSGCPNWRRQHGYARRALDALGGAPAGTGAADRGRDRRGGGWRDTRPDRRSSWYRPGGEPAVMAPLAVHPYDAAFEELRDAADAFESTHGHRPRVYLAGVGSIAEQVARKNYATQLLRGRRLRSAGARGEVRCRRSGSGVRRQRRQDRGDLLHRQAICDARWRSWRRS